MAGPVNPLRLVHSPATQYEDGEPIAAGDIARYEYGFGTTQGQYTTIKQDLNLTADENGKQFFLVPSDLPDGQWYSAPRAVTKKGAVAEWGNEVPFVRAPKKPKPISDFSAA